MRALIQHVRTVWTVLVSPAAWSVKVVFWCLTLPLGPSGSWAAIGNMSMWKYFMVVASLWVGILPLRNRLPWTRWSYYPDICVEGLRKVVWNITLAGGFHTSWVQRGSIVQFSETFIIEFLRMHSQSHFMADSQSVCLGVKPILWTFDQILLLFQVFGSEMCCLVSVGRPVWREVRSVLVCLLNQSQSHFTADSMSWCRAHFVDIWPDIASCGGALFEERPGLSLCVLCIRVRVTLRLTVTQYVLVSSPLCRRLTIYCFLFKCLGLKCVVLSLWGALSDERPGLPFVSHSPLLLCNVILSHVSHNSLSLLFCVRESYTVTRVPFPW
jgi:hypothetical protein